MEEIDYHLKNYISFFKEINKGHKTMKLILLPFLMICSLSGMFIEKKAKTIRLKVAVDDDYCTIIEVSSDRRNRSSDNIILEIHKNSTPIQLLNIEVPEIIKIVDQKK